MTTELATTETALAAPMQQRSATAMRLVEWAEEAAAAHQLASALCKTAFAGQFKDNPGGATAAILRGHEMGLTPVTSLAAFDLIQGQPAPKAITLRALVQSHGHDLEIVESNNERAVARYRRNGRGDWLTCEWTIEQARGLGLLSKDNWKKQPQTMLEARVTSKAARLVASDVILGIGYSAEELRDGDAPTVTQTRVTSADILPPTAPAEPVYEPSGLDEFAPKPDAEIVDEPAGWEQ
jgi:hypothetical protein